MKKSILTIIIIAVVLVGGYFLFFSDTYQAAPSVPQPSVQQPTSPASKPSAPETTVNDTVEAEEMEEEYVVKYTESGYSPSSIAIEAGETVTFVNNSSRAMWTASAVHPSHRIYSGTSLSEHCGSSAENTSFDACKGVQPGDSWSFTFDKIGSWKYHNHLSPSHTGTIVVE